MVLIQEGTKAKGLQKLFLKMKLGCKLQIVVTFFFEKEPFFLKVCQQLQLFNSMRRNPRCFNKVNP